MARTPLLLLLALVACGLGEAAASAAAPGVHRGTLSTSVADDFARGTSRERVVLAAGDGSMQPVRPADAQARRELRDAMGSRVVLEAASDGGTLVAQSVEPVGAAAPERSPRVAILRLNFTDDRSVPVTADGAAAGWFDGTYSVRAFYEQQSFGSLHVTGDVHGLYALGIAGAACDIEEIAQAADEAAAADGVDLSTYDHVAYVHPRVDACGYAGLAQMPGRRMWINGNHGLRVLAHELGHNRGAAHADAMSCTDAGGEVPVSDSCTSSEYGDPFDVMGGGSLTLMSSWHRHEIGGYEDDPTAVRQIGATGTYTLDSADTAGGVDVLTIPRPGSSQQYALELRTPSSPFDDFAPTHPAVTGVTARLVGGGTWWNAATRLVDAHPGGSRSDAPIPVGGEVTEPARGIRIRVDSITGGQAQVTVTLGVGDSSPPSAPVLNATRAGRSVHLTWTAASDDKGVVGYEVRRNGATQATTTQTSFEETPGVGVHRYDVAALDGAGNRTASNEMTVVVPDTTPPSAPFITSVVQQGGEVVLRWNAATDDVALRGYRVRVDGALAGETTGTAFTHAPARSGIFRYRVDAVDAAGNVASSNEVPFAVTDPVSPLDLGDTDEAGTSLVFTTTKQTLGPSGPAAAGPSSGDANPAPTAGARRNVRRGALRVRLTPGIGETTDRVTARVSSPTSRVTSVVMRLDGKRLKRCGAKRGSAIVTCAAKLPRSARTGAHRLRIVGKLKRRGRRASRAGIDLSLVAGRLGLARR